MKEPHLLLASSNPMKLKSNLVKLLDPKALQKIQDEMDENVRQLFKLGQEHYGFGYDQIKHGHWRQAVSRLYYGAYNVSRSVRLCHSGHYSRLDSSDHKKVGELPPRFTDVERYKNQLEILREDRNLCDYDHTAVVTDLALSPQDAASLVKEFIDNAKSFLAVDKGVSV